MCEPFAIFPRRMLRAGLSHREQSVLLCLLSYKNNDGEAWPSRATIATDTGLHISNVHKAVKSLAQKGVIAMNTQSGVRTVYTFPCLDSAAIPDIPAIAENHTAKKLDMVDHAPVIAKSATTDTDEGRGQNVTPLATHGAGQAVPKTVTIEKPTTADNPSPVEQSGNSGMLPEQPASVPSEVKATPTQLPAIVMAENAKPHNVSDEFMQELNARPIVAPKHVDDASLRARALRLQALQAENSARSRAEKLASRGLLNAGGQNDAAPESALATATPADNLPPVAKTEEQAVKTEGLAAPVESIAQPAPDETEPITLPAVVHESQESAPQPALPIICAPQTVAPQQGELLPAPVTAGQGELLPAPAKQKRACRLPDDWRLPRSWGEWATQEMGMTADAVRWEADKFADYWHAKAGANACKVNWQATWRNWIRKNSEQGGRAPQQKSKMTQALDNLSGVNIDWKHPEKWNPFAKMTDKERADAQAREDAKRNKERK